MLTKADVVTIAFGAVAFAAGFLASLNFDRFVVYGTTGHRWLDVILQQFVPVCRIRRGRSASRTRTGRSGSRGRNNDTNGAVVLWQPRNSTALAPRNRSRSLSRGPQRQRSRSRGRSVNRQTSSVRPRSQNRSRVRRSRSRQAFQGAPNSRRLNRVGGHDPSLVRRQRIGNDLPSSSASVPSGIFGSLWARKRDTNFYYADLVTIEGKITSGTGSYTHLPAAGAGLKDFKAVEVAVFCERMGPPKGHLRGYLSLVVGRYTEDFDPMFVAASPLTAYEVFGRKLLSDRNTVLHYDLDDPSDKVLFRIPEDVGKDWANKRLAIAWAYSVLWRDQTVTNDTVVMKLRVKLEYSHTVST